MRAAVTAISGSGAAVAGLVAVLAVFSAFDMSPRGPWDDDVLLAIEVAAWLGVLFALLSTVLLILPAALRWLRWWWLLPPVMVLLAAIGRLAWVAWAYPVG
ncbi:hypothetical protein [Nocardia donostiensis]|uniref:Uncharacterized protein n=1 Tax=Nocardia donostiensis TaxID=1538463 RepID=A0A1V2TEN8_9NOCA|nr:hypothetical protein [Nocardia donostiensis]ONM47965.1 hypothetical protein B0T46_15130 [Nocardia donostiensis]OQS13122.1 hypothetical protein B0T36_21490 [Nocardia donostiensis]OQS21508.1 hypothetical protein B0T44_07735 [Nocardia donostiensis]